MGQTKKSPQNSDTLILLSYIGLLLASTVNMAGYMARSPMLQGLSILGTLTAFAGLTKATISCVKEESQSKPIRSIPKNEPRSF